MRVCSVQTGAFLATILFLPSLMLGLGASSMAPGVLVSLLFLFLLSFQSEIDSFFKIKKIFFYFFLFFLIFFAIGHLRGFLQHKSYVSFFAFCFIVFFSYQFSRKRMFTESISQSLIIYFYFAFLFFAFFSVMTDFKFGYYAYGVERAVFPFKEPSHFSLAFGPFLISSVVVEKRIYLKVCYLIFTVAAGIILQSATLFAYIFMIGFLFFRLKLFSFLILAPLIGFLLFFIFNDPYYSSRILISSSSGNLTALVYLQGLQDAYNALVNTGGLGLGFQMLGSQSPSEAHYHITTLLGESNGGSGLNRMDGGFLAAKIIAEFGVVGIAVLGCYLVVVARSFLFLRSRIFLRNDSDACAIFFMSSILASVVEFFVRGVGYFSPSLFLLFAGVFFYFLERRAILSYE